MKRSEELRDFALLFCQAITSGDVGFLERHLSRHGGRVFIGAGSREWWTSDADAVKAYAAQTPDNGRGVQLTPGDPQAYQEGNVGWVADLAKIRLPDATEIPCRLTMVWHQDEGQWKIVQLHLSVGVGCDNRCSHTIERQRQTWEHAQP